MSIEQLKSEIMRTAKETNQTTAQVMAALLEAFLMSETEEPGHIYGLELAKALDGILVTTP